MNNHRPLAPDAGLTRPDPPPPFSSSFGRRIDRQAEEALVALWLLEDVVLGEAPLRDEEDLQALREALETVTWHIDCLDVDPAPDPESEADLAAIMEMHGRGGGSVEVRVGPGTLDAPSPSPWHVTPS